MLFSGGLADPAVPFEEVVNYYERVVASRGDLEATRVVRAPVPRLRAWGTASVGRASRTSVNPSHPAVPPEQAADA